MNNKQLIEKINIKLGEFSTLQTDILPIIEMLRDEKRATKAPYTKDRVNSFIDNVYNIVNEVENYKVDEEDDIAIEEFKQQIFSFIDLVEDAMQHQLELDEAYESMNEKLDDVIKMTNEGVKFHK